MSIKQRMGIATATLLSLMHGVIAEDVQEGGAPPIVYLFPQESRVEQVEIPKPSDVHSWTVLETLVGCNCNAMVVPDVRTVLAPGSPALVHKLMFLPHGRRGQSFVTLTTKYSQGDTEKEIEKVWDVRYVDLLNVPEAIIHMEGEETVLRLARGSHPMKWNHVTVHAIGFNRQLFSPSIKELADNSWELSIRSNINKKEIGSIPGKLEFSFNNGHESISRTQRCSLLARNVGDVAATPSSLFLGVIPEGESGIGHVALRSRSGSAFSISSVSSSLPERMTIEQGPIVDGKGAIKIDYRAPKERGGEEGEILVQLQDGTNLHIPFAAISSGAEAK